MESTEQYFPGAQSSSLMVYSGNSIYGAFSAFRVHICMIIAVKSLTLCMFGRLSALLICECRVFEGTCRRRLRGCMLESILLLFICPQFYSSQTSSISGSTQPSSVTVSTQHPTIVTIGALNTCPCQVGPSPSEHLIN